MPDVWYALRPCRLRGVDLERLEKLPVELVKHLGDEKLDQLRGYRYIGRSTSVRYQYLKEAAAKREAKEK